MTTFAQYEKPAYDDAVTSATRYVGLYPKSPETPYMYYLGGMSYYNQITNVMQDQTNSAKALAFFSALVEKFPDSEYAADARLKMQVARDQLAAEGNVDRPLLSDAQEFPRRDQPFSRRARQIRRPPATPRRRSIASPRPIAPWA